MSTVPPTYRKIHHINADRQPSSDTKVTTFEEQAKKVKLCQQCRFISIRITFQQRTVQHTHTHEDSEAAAPPSQLQRF